MKSLKKIFQSLFEDQNKSKIEVAKLEKGKKIELKISQDLLDMGTWRITKWHVQVGDNIKPGDILCTIESKNLEADFESFVEGKISYQNTSLNTIDKDTVIVELVGAE